MTAETGFFRGENGLVLEMDLPLHDGFEGRLKRGEVVRVANADGDPWEPEPTAAASAAAEADDIAELREEHAALVTENAELSDELALITKQRDELAVELGQVKEQLAQVTKQRDEILQDEQADAAKPATSRAKTSK